MLPMKITASKQRERQRSERKQTCNGNVSRLKNLAAEHGSDGQWTSRNVPYTGPCLDINPSFEVSIALNSSVTLMDFDAMLSRSSDSTTDAPDSSAATSRLAACATKITGTIRYTDAIFCNGLALHWPQALTIPRRAIKGSSWS